jgi:phospholipid-binding lipoprotein MlaA
MDTWIARALRGALPLALVALLPACATDGPDPLERTNRSIFAFNEGVDEWVLEPVARGYDWVLPELVQTGVRNVFTNLVMPVTLLNDILQAKPLGAAEDLGRIVINTTAGIGGIFDVASMIDIPKNSEDFGQTLGRWGVPTGPYLVVPLLGPSTVRDVWQYPVDGAARPLNYFIPLWATATIRVVENFSIRAYYLEELDEARANALDYYVFVRDAYLQLREHAVTDGAVPPTELQDDLYEFEDEDATAPLEAPPDDLGESEDE